MNSITCRVGPVLAAVLFGAAGAASEEPTVKKLLEPKSEEEKAAAPAQADPSPKLAAPSGPADQFDRGVTSSTLRLRT